MGEWVEFDAWHKIGYFGGAVSTTILAVSDYTWTIKFESSLLNF